MLIAVAPVAGARLEAGATSQTIAQAEFAATPTARAEFAMELMISGALAARMAFRMVSKQT